MDGPRFVKILLYEMSFETLAQLALYCNPATKGQGVCLNNWRQWVGELSFLIVYA